jgi:hypothetical protein
MPRVGISASMPAEMAEALHASARRARRSFSEELRIAIRAHLGSDTHPNTSEGPAPHGALAKTRDVTAHARAE